MRSLLVGLVLCTSACGRIGFGERADMATPDDADPDPDDGTGDRFDPVRANCETANSGPFAEVGRYTTNDAARGIWIVDDYILVASAAGGLESLTFDGAEFQKIDEITGIGWVETLWNDGTYLYISAPGTSVSVAQLRADGTLDLLVQDTSIDQARQIWGDGTNIYIPWANELVAFRWNGSALEQVGAAWPSTGWTEGGWWDGAYHYLANIDGAQILTFDGSTFTKRTAVTGATGYTRVWGSPDALFTSHDGGLTAFRYDGTTVDELDTITNGPTGAYFMWTDGVHAFVSGGEDGTFAYSFDGTNLTQLDVANSTGDNLQVIGDGTYIYVAGMTSQVIAYRGFECTAIR